MFLSCYALNLYNTSEQDARTTTIYLSYVIQFSCTSAYSIIRRISSKGDFSSTADSSAQNSKTNLAFNFPFCKPVAPDLKTSQFIPSLLPSR
ncbi:MAG: hypothetical protein AAF630_10440 [Cyanobacteria bacterium P01_C01_bin.38]